MGLPAMAASPWVLPVYCSDTFQTDDMMPFFFSEAEMAAGWVRSGRPADEAMLLLHSVMDLRTLVANMGHTDAMPWSKFQLVTSAKAYQLAQSLMPAQSGE